MWTGSKEFNITIRRRAKAKLLSLSQHGFKKGDGSLLPFDQFQTEDDIFKFFEMYTVIPELRG
jgi:DNA polymerase/3'-5' exonuclease PolX